MNKFKDKVVIITGAAGGIGKVTANKLYLDGANVVLVDLNIDSLKEVVNEYKFSEDRHLILQANVTLEEDVKNYVDKTLEKFKKIDCFFNNAGIEGGTSEIENYSVDTFDAVYNVNVKGAFLGLKYVLPVMKNQKFGTVVNTASGAGLMASPGMVGYIMSKHAMIGITRVAALETAAFGVRVNAVAPGVINTRMMRQIEENTMPGAGQAAIDAFSQAVPMGRYGEPEEVANVVAFLLSDESKFVTQSIYTVDGGQLNQ